MRGLIALACYCALLRGASLSRIRDKQARLVLILGRVEILVEELDEPGVSLWTNERHHAGDLCKGARTRRVVGGTHVLVAVDQPAHPSAHFADVTATWRRAHVENSECRLQERAELLLLVGLEIAGSRGVEGSRLRPLAAAVPPPFAAPERGQTPAAP